MIVCAAAAVGGDLRTGRVPRDRGSFPQVVQRDHDGRQARARRVGEASQREARHGSPVTRRGRSDASSQRLSMTAY